MSEYQSGANTQQTFAPEDIEKNKVVSALAYILFFLPLVAGHPVGLTINGNGYGRYGSLLSVQNGADCLHRSHEAA